VLLRSCAEHIADLFVVDLDICKSNLKFPLFFFFKPRNLLKQFLDNQVADPLIVILLVLNDLQELVGLLVSKDGICFAGTSHSICK